MKTSILNTSLCSLVLYILENHDPDALFASTPVSESEMLIVLVFTPIFRSAMIKMTGFWYEREIREEFYTGSPLYYIYYLSMPLLI